MASESYYDGESSLQELNSTLLLIAFVLGMMTLFVLPTLFVVSGLMTPLALLILLASAVLLVLMLLLARKNRGPVSNTPFLIGWGAIIGGLFFDLALTMISQPDLSREGPNIARSMFESGYGMFLIYMYDLFMTTLLAGIFGVWWLAFLSNYQAWLNEAAISPAGTFFQYLKNTAGGCQPSAIFRTCYMWSWMTWTVVFFTVVMTRFYSGVAMTGLLPAIHPLILFIVFGLLVKGGFIFHLHGIYRHYQSANLPA